MGKTSVSYAGHKEVLTVKLRNLLGGIVFIAFLSACSSSEMCPACGRENADLIECPVCNIHVCEYCADDEWYIEDLINSGKIQDILECNNYVVFDTQALFELYMYGFATGYNKGSSGVYDDEVKEAESWNYDYLQSEYGEYGW